MISILIKNGRVWTGNEFVKSDVLIDGKYIKKIAENITENADYTFDASGMIVSPGFVDVHVHLKGIGSDLFGVQAEMSSFPFGVTAVNDADGRFGDRCRLDAFAVKNTVFAGTDICDNHADFTNTEKYLDRYGDKAIGVKAYFDVTVSDVRDIVPLKEICDYARAKKLMVMVHCSHSPVPMKDIVETLSAGDILTHSFHGGENCCCEDNFAAIRLAKEKGVVIDSGFAGYIHTNFKNFQKSVKYGYIPDTISTDITAYSAYKRGGRYGMTMCMSMAKYMGMSEDDVFKAVTSNPARVLGISDMCGYLQEGRIADIAVVYYANEGFSLTDADGNHIESATGYRCVLTVSDGQIVYRH